MTILTIRTDKPEAEIGLYSDNAQLSYKTWPAHRKLAETIHRSIKEILDENKYSWSEIEGLVYYKGPGSFTGLRIGASLANALAVANDIPATAQTGDGWIASGIKDLQENKSKIVLPHYGAEPHVTVHKK